MTGYSLHIGLNYVDPAAYDGWDGELSGCINDANAMMQLAAAQGFQTNQLLDGDATSHAVIGELSLLAQQATAGDICLITYSGHGGQVDDANGDEPDFRDETWVLYDRQVVDDELYQMWSQFDPGVRLFVISDSCHSGTVAKMVLAPEARDALAGTSAREQARDGHDELDVSCCTPKNLPMDVQMTDNQRRRGTYQFVQSLSGPKSDAHVSASLILLSGCQDNQLSYDGAVNGQFTGTLLRIWDGGGFSGDHQSLHSAILAQMPPDQSPNLFTVGAENPAFMSQRPFTVASPVTGGSVTGGGSSTATARPTLRRGSTGADVQYLQQRLNAHGATLTADGNFGPATEMAVRGFQSTQGLAADGVVGPATWNALDTAPITGGDSTGTSTGGGGSPQHTGGATGGNGTVTVATRPLVKRGHSGEHVSYLQERLIQHGYHVTMDGIFGPGTESAVRSFQRSNGLVADGIVGNDTWAVLG